MSVLERYRYYTTPPVTPPSFMSDTLLLEILQARRTPSLVEPQAVALKEVQRRYSAAPLKEQPLKAGVRLGRLGNSNFKLQSLKERLAEQGIRWSKDVQSATHVLIGPKLPSLEALSGRVLVLDSDVQAFLDTVEQPYLQAAKYQPIMRDLLLSTDEGQQQIALQLIQQGGFPSELLAPAFIVSKTSSNSTLRQVLKTYLQHYLPLSYHEAIYRNYALQNTEEFKIARNLRRYSKLLNVPDGPLIGLDIGRALFEQQRSGFQFLWNAETTTEGVLDTFRAFIDGASLSMVGKGFNKLSMMLRHFSQLERVDLSDNYALKSFPAVLTQLPCLRELNLVRTSIIHFYHLAEMPALRTLHLGGLVQDLHPYDMPCCPWIQTLYIEGSMRATTSDHYAHPMEDKNLQKLLKKKLPNATVYWS